MCVCVYTCCCPCMEAREHLVKISSSTPLCGFQGRIQAATPLATEPPQESKFKSENFDPTPPCSSGKKRLGSSGSCYFSLQILTAPSDAAATALQEEPNIRSFRRQRQNTAVITVTTVRRTAGHQVPEGH